MESREPPGRWLRSGAPLLRWDSDSAPDPDAPQERDEREGGHCGRDLREQIEHGAGDGCVEGVLPFGTAVLEPDRLPPLWFHGYVLASDELS